MMPATYRHQTGRRQWAISALIDLLPNKQLGIGSSFSARLDMATDERHIINFVCFDSYDSGPAVPDLLSRHTRSKSCEYALGRSASNSNSENMVSSFAWGLFLHGELEWKMSKLLIQNHLIGKENKRRLGTESNSLTG
jgi:hypothetical protein